MDMFTLLCGCVDVSGKNADDQAQWINSGWRQQARGQVYVFDPGYMTHTSLASGKSSLSLSLSLRRRQKTAAATGKGPLSSSPFGASWAAPISFCFGCLVCSGRFELWARFGKRARAPRQFESARGGNKELFLFVFVSFFSFLGRAFFSRYPGRVMATSASSGMMTAYFLEQ